MTDSDPGTSRRGLGRVAEQVSGAAQTAVDRVTSDRSGSRGEGQPGQSRTTTRPASSAT